jgi:hypothetical protein
MVLLSLIFLQYTDLKELSVINCMIDDGATPALCRGSLKENASLRLFDVGGNQIGDSGTSALAKFVSGNKTLKILDVRNTNNIADAGLVSLGRVLESNNMLKELLPCLEKIASANKSCIRAILNGIMVNRALIHANVPGKLSESREDELHFYLDRNEHVRPLLSMSTSLALWPNVLKRPDDCRLHTHYTVCRGPDLLYFLVKE